jgi:hypothetical protein
MLAASPRDETGETPPLSPGRVGRTAAAAALFAGHLLVVTLLQLAGGAFHSEFGGAADEAAHCVTGLLVRDYVAQGFPHNPMRFAENYYLHYPQIAFGHWPPVFYLLQACWTLLLPDTRASLLVLMGCVTAATATVLHLEIRKRVSTLAAFVFPVIFLSLPKVQQHSSMVMADLLVSLLYLGAALLLVRFFRKDTYGSAAACGLAASILILTKANGLAMAAVPLMAALALREYRRLRTFRFWLPAAMVGVLCAPFYVWSWHLLQRGTEPYPMTGARILASVARMLWMWGAIAGWPLVALAAAGMAWLFVRPLRAGNADPAWAVLGCAWLAAQMFNSAAPTSPDPRKIFSGLPIVVMFAAAGTVRLARLSPWPRLSPGRKQAAVMACVAAAYAVADFRIPRLPERGLGAAAADLLGNPDFHRSVILVSSNDIAEQAFVGQVAAGERRPTHYVIRASKFLADASWHGYRYQLRYDSPETMKLALERVPVGVLVLHTESGKPQPAHHALLKSVVNDSPGVWKKLRRYDTRGAASGGRDHVVEVYIRPEALRPQAVHLELDLSGTLNRVIRSRAPSIAPAR